MKATRIAYHPNGDLVVAEYPHLYLLDGDGQIKITTTVRSFNTRKANSPEVTALAISPQGQVYIAQSDSPLISVLSETGTYLQCFSTLPANDYDTNESRIVETITDMDGNLLVVSGKGPHVITIHTCPSGEITNCIKLTENPKYGMLRGTVNSKKQILLYHRTANRENMKVVALDYSGNELYSFTSDVDKKLDEGNRSVCLGGIACDSYDNVFLSCYITKGFGDHTQEQGYILKYSPTGEFLACIDTGHNKPHDLSIAPDSTLIAVAAPFSSIIQIYNLE